MSIDDVLSKHQDDLMDLPNVVLVGKGERGGKEVILVHVTRKVPEAELGGQAVPKTLDGYETVVQESGPYTAQ